MHQTLTRVRHQIRLRRAPAGQRGRPLPRPAQIEDSLARLDNAAVDDPGHGRRYLPGRDGDHGLVEQRNTLGGLTQQDQGLPPAEPAESHQVRVAEAVPDLGGLSEGGVRARAVAAGQAPQRDRQEHVALLHAVVLAVVEQLTGPRQPAAAAGHLAPVQKAESQPERATRGTLLLAAAQELVIGATPQIGGVVIAAE